MPINKKILYLRTDLGMQYSTGGGSVSHTLGVIKGFHELEYEVTIASSAMHPVLQKLPFLTFYPLVVPRIISWLPYKAQCLLSSLIFTHTCAKIIKRHKPDFLYQRSSCLNITGALLSIWYQIPLIIEFNGPEAWADKHWGPKRFWRFSWLVNTLETFSMRRAHSVITVSEPLKKYLLTTGIHERKIVINPNGVDVDIFNPALLVHEGHALRQHYGLEHTFIFGFIGTFGPWHGAEIIAHIIPTLSVQFPHAHFLFIGTGPQLVVVKEKLHAHRDVVTFVGAVEYTHARRYLAACDAFMCPTQPNTDGSRFFGSPTKLFEYLSMGKPIIASALEQMRDIIQPAVFVQADNAPHTIPEQAIGFLVEPTDTQGFITAARMVLTMTEQQKEKMGQNARTLAQQKHSWIVHTKKIVARM